MTKIFFKIIDWTLLLAILVVLIIILSNTPPTINDLIKINRQIDSLEMYYQNHSIVSRLLLESDKEPADLRALKEKRARLFKRLPLVSIE